MIISMVSSVMVAGICLPDIPSGKKKAFFQLLAVLLVDGLSPLLL